MKLHTTTETDIDPDQFERETLEQIGMPKELPMRHRTPHFMHIFSSDAYSAGYYSYLWSDALTADAAEVFKEAGSFYDQPTAKRLHDNVMSVGDTIDPAEGFRKFRGRDVDTRAPAAKTRISDRVRSPIFACLRQQNSLEMTGRKRPSTPISPICLMVAIVLVAAALLARGWLVTRAEDASGRFQPPGERERLAAIGATRSLGRVMQQALQPGKDFDPIPMPEPSDWLANHRESGQTFDQYQRSQPNRPDGRRNKLYLQPLGEFDPDKSPALDKIERFAESFFQMEVEILPGASLDGLPIQSRSRAGGLRQLLTGDLLKWCEGRLPADAYCLLAVTMEDLYPDERWNFVFGQASLNKRVGVYSFARYSPRFYGRAVAEDGSSLLLSRSCKVLGHETGHMFGIKHCVHFHCLMNGSNHLGESDQQPLHLCPVCLRKLHWAKAFDVADRYRKLQSFSKDAGWRDEADWLERRLDALK